VSGWLLGLAWLAATIGVCALVPTMLETSRDARDQPEPRVD
jgi:hypothetical protein